MQAICTIEPGMKPADTLAEAAEIIATHAEELRILSSCDGDWGDAHAARTEYQRMVRIARQLRAQES